MVRKHARRVPRKVAADERIYAVVADTVHTEENGTVEQVAGRLAAQAVHAVSKMKMHRMAEMVRGLLSETKLSETEQGRIYNAMLAMAEEAITTIILGCRDSNELNHLRLLLSNDGQSHYIFDDENLSVYGQGRVTTAFATLPVKQEEMLGILDYLPLWSPKN